MKLLPYLTTLLFICYWSEGLAQYYYLPDNNTPLLMVAEKGDLNISGTIPFQTSFAAQVAYSPLKSISLSLSYLSHEKVQERPSVITSGESFSAAIGAYVFYKSNGLNTQKSHINLLVDGHVGYTRSSIFNQYASVTSAQLRYQKFFVSLGLHVKARWLAISYAIKLSSLDYQAGEVYGFSQNQILRPVNQEILVNEPYYLWETDLRINIGPEALRGFAGITMLNPNVLEKVLVNEQNLIFSVGLNIGLNHLVRFEKKK